MILIRAINMTFLMRCIFLAPIMLTLTELIASSDTIVGFVNTEAIEKKEFLFFMSKNRSEVYSYLINKYKMKDSVFHWDKSYGGEIPEEILRRKAWNELIYYKVQKILFKEARLVNDISFESFLHCLKIENEQRQFKSKNGEIVFGPLQFSEKAFYDHSFNLLKSEYIKHFASGLSDSLLFQHYERIKDDKLRSEDGSVFSFEDSRSIVARDLAFVEYKKLVERRLAAIEVKFFELN